MKYTAPDGAIIITNDPAALERFKAAHPGSEASEEEESFPKHTGGAWYELSDGEKVQGEDAARAAQDALDG